MQGHDSVEIKADIELGGSEQLFSLMVGRGLQTDAGQEPQICLTLPILCGLDGVRRMGKSLNNYVGVGESAYDQFAKTMSIPDTLMNQWFELLTDRSTEEIARFLDPAQTHPREAKKMIGHDIVAFYHGEEAAVAACVEWVKRNTQGEDPTEIPEAPFSAASLTDGKILIGKLLVALKLAPSGNAARRLVQGGGVTIGPDRAKVGDPNAAVDVAAGLVVRVGSRKIARVRLV